MTQQMQVPNNDPWFIKTIFYLLVVSFICLWLISCGKQTKEETPKAGGYIKLEIENINGTVDTTKSYHAQ